MPNFERRLFDLIESVSVGPHDAPFSEVLSARMVAEFQAPLRIAAASVLHRADDRYLPQWTSGLPVWPQLAGMLGARALQRRLGREAWWVQRGLRLEGAGAGWYDLIVIPFDRSLDVLLAVVTESLAGEEGRERESSYQVMTHLIRLFVDRHHHRSRLQQILDLAAQQQMSVLPTSLPAVPGYSMSARSLPAEEVGGDYYQTFMLPQGGAGFAVADAKGKGFEAAMQVTALHAAMRVVNELPFKLAARVAMMNRALGAAPVRSDWGRPGGIAGRSSAALPAMALAGPRAAAGADAAPNVFQGGEFPNLITLFLAEFDQEGRFLYVNCSHPPPFWVAAGGIQTLTEGGRFLGLDARSDYRFGIAQLQRGDLIVAYTDGWSELFNERGEEFGAERLRELLRGMHGAAPDAVMEAIAASADQFRGETGFADDRTLVVLRKD